MPPTHTLRNVAPHPEAVRLGVYDNSLNLAARINNWESLYKVYKKVRFAARVTKEEFDAVIHRVVGSDMKVGSGGHFAWRRVSRPQRRCGA